MSKFEVVIVYKGQSSYLVDADDEETAETLATAKFRKGDPGDPVGNEYEDIENIVTHLQGEWPKCPDAGKSHSGDCKADRPSKPAG